MFQVINIKKIKRRLLPAVLAACALLAAIWAFSLLFPLAHTALIYEYAGEYGLDPAFVCAVIHAESKFKKDALSPKGASGLMQLTEPTAVWLAEKMGLSGFEPGLINEPETNIKIGCYNLKRLLDKYDGDRSLALAAYNAGEGSVARWLQDPSCSADGKTLTRVPYGETKEYIKRVEFNFKIYRGMLNMIGGMS